MLAYHTPWQCLEAPHPSPLLTFPSRFSTSTKISKTINNNRANSNNKYSLRCKKTTTTTRGITVFNSLNAQQLQQQQTDKTSSLLQPYSIKIPVGEREIVIETGRIGRQASASITVTDGETIVYTSVCLSDVPSEPSDFLPLTVNYQERFSAAGRTSGGFYKREGKTKDKEILVCRLIDRPLRPTILKGFYHEVQILSWVVSYDNIHFPDTLAIIAAGTALALSEVPISKPVAGVRVGLIGDKFLVNPTVQQMNLSKLDLIIAGTSDAILTIEGYCDFLSEESLLEAVEVGHVAIKKVCSELENLARMHGKAKLLDTIRLPADELKAHVEKLAGNNLLQALKIKSKIPRMRAISAVEEDVLSILTDSGLVQEDPILKPEEVVSEIEDDEEDEEAVDGEVDEGDVHIKPMLKKPVTQFFDPVDVKLAFKELSSKIMRRLIVQDGRRSDGRTTEEVRPIVSQCGLLPRAHGSALFTRGETQSLAVTTLGGSSMGQRIDNLTEEEIKHFYLQYTFPPSSVGEVGRIGSPSRREVGHGMLAERALEPSLPSEEEFPYIIRVESTITESNGSSSMASVCGGCLAMLDAGVPLKCSIAGIAMGMIFDTKTSGGDGSPLILSDIIGSEDALGDMDLKVAGNEKGITAFQMDLKLTAGITLPTLAKAVLQARKGISHILGEMKKCSPPPCETMSKYAPRIYALKVDINKLYLIIGSGGRTVKNIIEESGVDSIDVQQHDGLVRIVSKDSESIEKARSRINALLLTPTVGDIFRNCEVKSVAAYGAFVEIAPGREGLLHVSEWDYTFIAKTEDVVKVGDQVDVKLIEVTERGHLRLSRRALLPKPEPSVKSSENPSVGIKGDKGIEDSITTAEETATNNAVGSVARKDDIIKKVFRVMKPESHKKSTTTSSPLTKSERHIKPVAGKTTVTKTKGSPATADSKQNPSTKQVVDDVEQKSQKDLSSASNQNKV